MRALPFALALALAACGGAPALEGDLVLNDPADEGKADSITGKALRYTVTMFAGWGGGSQWNSGVQMSSLRDSSTVRVTGAATVFQPDENFHVTTESHEGLLTDFLIDMVMLPFARRVPESGMPPKFTRLTCAGVNYASEILVDPTNQEIDLLGYKASVAKTFKLSDCGVPAGSDRLQVAVLPVVAHDWGTIDGEYSYSMKAECAIGSCPEVRMVTEGP